MSSLRVDRAGRAYEEPREPKKPATEAGETEDKALLYYNGILGPGVAKAMHVRRVGARP